MKGSDLKQLRFSAFPFFSKQVGELGPYAPLLHKKSRGQKQISPRITQLLLQQIKLIPPLWGKGERNQEEGASKQGDIHCSARVYTPSGRRITKMLMHSSLLISSLANVQLKALWDLACNPTCVARGVIVWLRIRSQLHPIPMQGEPRITILVCQHSQPQERVGSWKGSGGRVPRLGVAKRSI